jgi:hypothetical protein
LGENTKYPRDYGDLFDRLISAHYLFVRSLGREPVKGEWLQWLKLAEERSGRPDTEEAKRLALLWFKYRLIKWREERQANSCAS